MISPYKSNLNPAFEKLHSYMQYGRRWPVPVSGYYKRHEHVYVCSYMNPKKIQDRYFADYEIEYVNPSPSKDMYPAEMVKGFIPRDQQQAFIDEAMYYTGSGYRKIFNNMQTGLGKTVSTVYMILEHHKKALIVTGMSEILNQWIQAFKDFTTLPEDRMWLCTKSSDLIDAGKDPMSVNQIDVFLMTHAMLSSLSNRIGWDGVSGIIANLGIGTKIYDEAHENLESMVSLDAFTSVEHTYYLTADFNQSSTNKSNTYHRIFYGVPILPMDSSNRTLKYVDVLSVCYNSYPKMSERAATQTSKGFSNAEYMRYQFRKEYIYKALGTLIPYLQERFHFGFMDHKILILTSLIEHSVLLYEWVQKTFPNKIVGLHHGGLDHESRQNARDNSEIIVSTYSSIKKGIDVHGISCVITCDQVDRITDNQCAGRARPVQGETALYVMLYDMGFDRCIRSKSRRMQYLHDSKAHEFFSIELKEMIQNDKVPSSNESEENAL